MGVVRKSAGAQSVSFFVTPDGETTEFDVTASTWANLPNGKLKDLLTATYLSGSGEAAVLNPAAFMEAYAEAGGLVVTAQYDNDEIEDAYWYLADAPALPTDPPKGSPVLHVWDLDSNGTAVRVSVSYSASE